MATRFQYHTGSIKADDAAAATLERKKRIASFNTTLVRLKRAEMLSSFEKGQLRFNTTLVRLKLERGDFGSRAADAGFNTTLVRLKRTEKKKMKDMYISVSIPHWFD